MGLEGFMSSRGRPVLAGGQMQMHYASYELAPAHLEPSLPTLVSLLAWREEDLEDRGGSHWSHWGHCTSPDTGV